MANTSLTQVFTGADTLNQTSTELNWPGGIGQMVVDGTFDTCTVELQMSPDDGTTWVPIGGDATVTEKAVVNFDLNGCDIRLELTSVGGSTSINGWLTRTVSDGIWGKGIMHCPN